ncbi:MAG: acyltransferase [Phycisphaerales bacterium]|nr:acyltransferase [Phycisphaerales bacterium]
MEPGQPVPPRRILGVDAGRVVASVATVWLHTVRSPELKPFGVFGKFAVPYFNFVAAMFLVESIERHPERRWRDYIRDRLLRLYVPFVVWAMVYYGLTQGNRVLGGVVVPSIQSGTLRLDLVPAIDWAPFIPSFLWVGPFAHLWYLPSLTVWCAVAFLLIRAVLGKRELELGLALACCIMGVEMVSRAEPAWIASMRSSSEIWIRHSSYLMERNWARLPSFLWGMALALVIRGKPDSFRLNIWTSIAGGVLAGSCLAYTLWYGERIPNQPYGQHNLLENLAGFGFLVVALGPWPERLVRWAAPLGALTFGVYLCHMMFIEGFHQIREYFGQPPRWYHGLTIVILSTALSYLLVSRLRRWRWSRWMVP